MRGFLMLFSFRWCGIFIFVIHRFSYVLAGSGIVRVGQLKIMGQIKVCSGFNRMPSFLYLSSGLASVY